MNEEQAKQFFQNAKTIRIKDAYGNEKQLTAKEAQDAGINLSTFYGNKSNPIYPTNSGGFTNDPYSKDIKISVNLNKDTGKITVMAPEYVTNRVEFKEQILPQLKDLSAAYKQNKDVKIASTVDNKEYTVEEWVNQIRDSITDEGYLSRAADIESLNNKMREAGYTDWDDKASSIYLYGNNEALSAEANDFTRVYVSDFGGVNYFKNMESFDADTGTISLKDFKEWYNREKKSDEDILEIHEGVTGADAEIGIRDEEGNLTKVFERSAVTTDAETIARRHALAKLVENKAPEMSAWQNIGDNTASIARGVADGLVGWIFDIADAIDGNSPTLASDYTQGRDYLNERQAVLNKGTAMSFTVSNLATLLVPVGAVGKGVGLAAKGLKSVSTGKLAANATELGKTATKLTEAAGKLEKAKTIPQIAKAVEGLDKALDTVKSAKVVESLSIALKAAKGPELVKMTSSILKTSKQLERLAKTEKAVARIGNIAIGLASFTVDSVLSSILIDKDLREKIFENDKDNEVTQELMVNLAVDAATFGALKAVGKGLVKAGETTVGQAISLNAARRFAKLDTVIVGIRSGIKNLVNRANETERIQKEYSRIQEIKQKNPKKGEALEANWRLNEAKKELAQERKIDWITGRSGEDIETGIARVRAKEMQVRRENVAIDMLQRTNKGKINEAITYSKANKETYDGLMNATRKLTKAEKAAGRTIGKRVRGVQDEGIARMSVDASNYISAKNRIGYLDRKGGDKIDSDGFRAGLNSGEKESYADAQSQIKTFMEATKEHPEVLEAANEYYEALAKFYKQYTDFFLRQEGVLSRGEIEDLRDTALWGRDANDYIHTQRVKERTGIFVPRDKKLTETMKHLENGKGHFADPTIVAMDWMSKLCADATRAEAARLIFTSNKAVLAGNTKTTIARNASHTEQAKFNKVVGESLGGAVEELSITAFTDVAIASKAKTAISKQKGTTEKAAKRLQKIKEKTYTSNRAQRSIFVSELPQERFDNLANRTVGYATPREYMQTLVDAGMTPEQAFGDWVESLPDHTKKMMRDRITERLEAQGYELAQDTDVLTLENFNGMADGDGLFERSIMNDLIGNTPEYRDSELVKEAISSEVKNYDLYKQNTIYREEYAELKKLQDEFGMTGDEGWAEGQLYDEARTSINIALDGIIEAMLGHNNGKTVQAVLDAAGESGDLAKEYIALRSLIEHGNKGKMLEKVRKAAGKDFEEMNKTLKSTTTANKFEKAKSTYANTLEKMVGGEITSRLNLAHAEMLEKGSPLADQEYMFQRANELMNDIEGYKSRQNVVPLGVKNGEMEYIETDPITADLIKSNSQYFEDTGRFFQNVNYISSKLFRLGTTGLRIKSWLMQMSRDSIALWSGTGLMQTLGKGMESMTEDFGGAFLRYLEDYDTMAYDEARKALMKSGKTGEELTHELEKYAVERYNAIGWGYSTQATETSAMQFRRENYGALSDVDIKKSGRKSAYDRVTSFIDDLTSRETVRIGGKNVINPFSINQRRESYMRKLAYTNSLNQALKRGYTVRDAMDYARFMMDNALTNFSRSTVHLSNLQKTVPYLGAAINGTKSFYRMLELDPVGVMGRLTGGVMLPAMALTCWSLSDEENRKVYRNIPEYTKRDNICIVVEGQVVTIPIPQEMSAIFGVARQFVEGLYDGSNIHEFWELAANNLLGISPIDITGYLNIDSKLMLSDDERFHENLDSGFTKMLSGLMNPVLKTGVTLLTHRDPYTGKRLDTAARYYDQDTGESYTVDYNSSELAKKVAGIFGDEVNAWMAQVVLDNLFGKVGTQITEDLVSLANGVVPSAVMTDVSGAFTTEVWDQAQSAWTNTMRALQDKKDAIVNSKEYQSAKQAAQFATPGSAEQQKAMNKQIDLLNPLYEATMEAVRQLNSKYAAQFTSKKFGAVISLLNTADELPVQATNQYLSNEASDLFYAGRNAAIETMARYGFSSTNDGSIFGYVKNLGNDQYGFAFRDPVAILAMEQLDYAQTDIHTANIEAALKVAGIKTSDMWDGYYKQATKADKTQYKKDWNTRVVKTIAPYVQRYGVENVVSNSTMVDFLDNYLFIDNPYNAKKYIIKIFKED